MRLSEAILAGSTLIKPFAGTIFSKDGERGCAIGMACAAIGIRKYIASDFSVRFPWLKNIVKAPCGCCLFTGVYADSTFGSYGHVANVIAHVFDNHVMNDSHGFSWTLEQLCEWVDSIDPTPKTVHEIVDDVMAKHAKTGVRDEEVDVAVPDAVGVSA